MKTVTLAFELWLLCFPPLINTVVPVPPPREQNKEKAIPQVAGSTNWGVITQTGDQIVIQGNASWQGSGVIRADGFVEIFWVNLASQRPATGVYATKTLPNLVGHWGWDDEAVVGSDGLLTGSFRDETLSKVE